MFNGVRNARGKPYLLIGIIKKKGLAASALPRIMNQVQIPVS